MPRVKQKPRTFFKAYKNPPVVAPGDFYMLTALKQLGSQICQVAAFRLGKRNMSVALLAF